MLHIKVSHACSIASPTDASIEVHFNSCKHCQALCVCLPSHGISCHLCMRICACMHASSDAVSVAGCWQGAVCSDPGTVVNAPGQEPAMQYLGFATPHPTTGTHPSLSSHLPTSISRQESDESLQSCSKPLCMGYMSDSLCASHAPPHSLHHTLQTLSVNGFCHHTLFRHGLALAQSAYTRICWMSAC